MRRRIITIIAAVVAASSAMAAMARAEAPQPYPIQRLNEATSWFANSYGGADRKWVQLGIQDIFVFPDGRVVTNTGWDESARAIGFYKDGDVLGNVKDYTALTGGLAVTADDQYLFALRAERKLEEVDPFWFGVARYTLDGKPAGWPGAEGRVRNVLFLYPPSKEGGRQLTGVAVHDGELYLSDPIKRTIRIYRTSDMSPLRDFALSPGTDIPFKTIFDRTGNLWIVQKSEAETWRIRKYSPAGNYAGVEITDAGVPKDMAIGNDGNLLVADGGPRLQIRRYDISATPKLLSTFGTEGGVYAEPVPGKVGPRRFCGLTGVGTDAEGNLYVSENGPGGGAILSKYDTDGNRLWLLEGLEFVDGADLDPADLTQAFSKDSWYSLDFSKQTTNGWPHDGWQHAAWTINPFKYPNDPRLHIRQEGPMVFRKNGKLFLACSFGDAWTGIYRFEGRIAVPAAMFSKGGPRDFPPNNPFSGQAWMWVDKSGDGDFQENEFAPIADRGLGVFRGQQVDDEGTYWLGEEFTCILHRFPIEKISDAGVPVYSTDSETKVDLKTISTDMTGLRDVKYIPKTDTMYLATYSKERPKTKNWCAMAKEIRRYDNWSKNPTQGLLIALPYSDEQNTVSIAMAPAGDYVFVAYMAGFDARHRVNGEVMVYRATDGSLVGALQPTEEVGGISGWIDFQVGALHAHVLPDGTYVVTAEEDARAKITLYQWKPTDAQPQPPNSLTAAVGEDRVILSWPRQRTAETYRVLRAVKPDPGEKPDWKVIADNVCRTDPDERSRMCFLDATAKPGETYSYAVKSVNRQGTSEMSPGMTVTVEAMPVLANDFEEITNAQSAALARTAGEWQITGDVAFSGKNSLQGSYNRSETCPLGPSFSIAANNAGRYHVAFTMAADHPIESVAVGVRSPRTHLMYEDGTQQIFAGTNKQITPLGERNGKSWFRVEHDVTTQPGKTLKSIQVELLHPHGSREADPTTVWIDDLQIYLYPMAAVTGGRSLP